MAKGGPYVSVARHLCKHRLVLSEEPKLAEDADLLDDAVHHSQNAHNRSIYRSPVVIIRTEQVEGPVGGAKDLPTTVVVADLVVKGIMSTGFVELLALE